MRVYRPPPPRPRQQRNLTPALFTSATEAQTVTGSLLARSPTFPTGAANPGNVTLTGVLLARSPTFPTGSVDATNTITGYSPVSAPVTNHIAFVTQAVLIDAVYVPAVLPFADLKAPIEVLQQIRKVNAARQGHVAQAKVFAFLPFLARGVVRGIFRCVLEVDRKRLGSRYQYACGNRGDLIAELVKGAAGVIVEIGRIKKRAEKTPERLVSVTSTIPGIA